eukprot:5469523-Prymnesium_polylepis.1
MGATLTRVRLKLERKHSHRSGNRESSTFVRTQCTVDAASLAPALFAVLLERVDVRVDMARGRLRRRKQEKNRGGCNWGVSGPRGHIGL